jgi:hypothetical protein
MGARRHLAAGVCTAGVCALGLALLAPAAHAAASPPDYRVWGELLSRYYDPARGMRYGELQRREKARLQALRQQLAAVDPGQLTPADQLAYWINLYNVSIVALVVDHYPVESVRDLSTDPIIRLNVFKKPSVRVKGGTLSLDEVEHQRIRTGFRDARIHFAVNCAAESCPPLRTEPYVGARLAEQLDDQTRKFLAGPLGARLEQRGGRVTVHVSKVMDWFAEDFERWPGGQVAFLKRHLPPEQRRRLEAAEHVELEFDDYSWKLNDASD